MNHFGYVQQNNLIKIMILHRIGSGSCHHRPDPNHHTWRFARRRVVTAFHERKNDNHRSVCTADELHFVTVSDSDWKLALWRYLPDPKVPSRNHPLLLLSGVATNAIGYDLSPESSFARYMSAQGFDTWTLEVRGAGLSTYGGGSFPQEIPYMKRKGPESEALTENIFTRLTNRVSNFFNGDVLRWRVDSAIADQIRELKTRLQNVIEEGHPLFPVHVLESFRVSLEEFQKQLEHVAKSDWDFDHYLEEDVPAAMEYIRTRCQPKDGKLHAIGHSMGGILLYALLSRCCFDGKNPGLASVVTLASSLDYTLSKSSLKMLLPLAEPVQALNIPVFPVGPLLATAYPLANYPPYILSWLNSQISAQDMMDQKLLEKLVLNNFCTVPSKLLLQLATAFEKGGLRDRSGSFFYKNHLSKSKVPVFAVAGDHDLICPPEAVYETVKLIPEELITYKVFGEPGGPHYAHFDVVGGRLAADQLYPCITEFLTHHDRD